MQARANNTAQRRTATALWPLVFGLTVIGLAVGGWYGWKWLFPKAERGDAVLLHKVERDDFRLAITERGSIESSGVTEVRSEIKSVNNSVNSAGVAILSIVPEGTEVKQGDFLLQLDSSGLEADRLTQLITTNTANAAVIEAKSLYDTAVIAREEYLNGVYVQERQTIESEVFVAEENLNRAREYYAYSQKLSAKGYVNQLQLEADRFAVDKSTKELDAAKTKLRVIDEYTKVKQLKTLESAIEIAEAKWKAMQNSYQLELDRLTDIEDQIKKCTIHAPKDGVVLYAHETDWRGSEEFVVEEGAIVRERQVIVNLPDSTSMRVVVRINESLIKYVQSGMKARITPVGGDGDVLAGEVKTVNRYAEPESFRKANVKEYKAFVDILEGGTELRSGMTASVTIDSQFVPDALQVPVQCVYLHGDKTYCFRRTPEGWQALPVKCGPTNDKFFVVEEGLTENDQIALNPKQFLEQVDLPKLERKRPTAVAQTPTAPATR